MSTGCEAFVISEPAFLSSLYLTECISARQMTECGISGGTPLASTTDADSELNSIASASISLSIPPPCKLHVKLDVPLALITGAPHTLMASSVICPYKSTTVSPWMPLGSGAFYNLYNEDAMGTHGMSLFLALVRHLSHRHSTKRPVGE